MAREPTRTKWSQVVRMGHGPGGWFVFARDDHPTLYVRFRRGKDGGYEPVELYLASDRPLDSEDLRRISLSQAQAQVWRWIPVWAPSDRSPGMERSLATPAPDFRGMFEQLAVPVGEAYARRRRTARLKIPDTLRKPDSFYRQVAEVYSALASETKRPAVEIAWANDVPVTSVHGWIKEARRRGFLPPGQKGRRG